MNFKTDGLILTQQTIKENDKMVTVLTKSEGIIRCFVRKAMLINGPLCGATQPLSYSRLTIYSGRGRYIIDEADPIALFFDLRLDLEKFALSQYFCEIAMLMIPEGSPADQFLSLLLNSLYMLSRGTKPDLLIKAVFEMRFMSIAGFMPAIMCCDKCGSYEADTMYFLYNDAKILCDSCCNGAEDGIALSRGALTAVRTATLAEPKKIFSFGISERALAEFADCAEKYLLTHIGQDIRTLEFYKKIRTI